MTQKQIQTAIARNEPLPAGLTTTTGYLDLQGYDHALPAGLTTTGALGGINPCRFYDGNEAALEDMRKLAEGETAVGA